jgi:hypothetical protein
MNIVIIPRGRLWFVCHLPTASLLMFLSEAAARNAAHALAVHFGKPLAMPAAAAFRLAA